MDHAVYSATLIPRAFHLFGPCKEHQVDKWLAADADLQAVSCLTNRSASILELLLISRYSVFSHHYETKLTVYF